MNEESNVMCEFDLFSGMVQHDFLSPGAMAVWFMVPPWAGVVVYGCSVWRGALCHAPAVRMKYHYTHS